MGSSKKKGRALGNQDKAQDRVTISGKVSPESAAGWRSFCEQNGITVAAMLEIAGLQLAAESFPPKVKERREMVEMARKIDRDRRDRRTSE